MGLNPNDLASWGRFSGNQGKVAISSEAAGEHAFRLGSEADGAFKRQSFEFELSPVAITTDIGRNITGEIRGVVCEIMELVVAGGTSVKVGIGIATDEDKYGKTADLLKNSKFTTQIDLKANGEIVTAEDILLSVVTAAGDDGDTAATAGKVRATIFYNELTAYANTA